MRSLRTDQTPATAGVREPLLDGVRGLAVLLVLAYHTSIFAGLEARTALDRFVLGSSGTLWVGVDLFFVLSGFLITGILYEAKGSPLFFSSFYGRRILRIFPLYYGFLAVALLLFPFWLPEESTSSLGQTQPWYWLYLSNVQVALSGWQQPLHLGHFWSLAVEEQFYLLWPLAVWALDRKWLARLAVACIVGALLLRLVQPFGMTDVAAHVLLPTRMDSLAAGALLALAIRGERGVQVLRYWPGVTLVACVLAVVAIHLPSDMPQHIRSLVRAVRYTLIAGAGVSLIALALTGSPGNWLQRIFGAAPLTFLGKYSYGLYVVQVPIILFMADSGLGPGSMPDYAGSQLPGFIVFAVACAALSIGFAVVIYHAWEERFLRLKQHLPYLAERSEDRLALRSAG